MLADEIEKIMIGVTVGVLTAFAAWLRRHYELKRYNRRPCTCPTCGHVHFRNPEDK